MPFVPVPNTLAVDVIYLLAGQRVENTLYFEQSGPWDAASVTAWLTALTTYIEEELMPALSTALNLIELVGRVLDAASSLSVSFLVSPPVTGSDTSAAMPNNVTYTIAFKTALSGRSFRGRNYVPGLSRDATVGNNIATTTRTALLAFYTGLIALATANSIQWVVVSRFSGVDPVTGAPVPRVTGVTTPILSVSTFDTVLDSQRRRLPGRGS